MSLTEDQKFIVAGVIADFGQAVSLLGSLIQFHRVTDKSHALRVTSAICRNTYPKLRSVLVEIEGTLKEEEIPE